MLVGDPGQVFGKVSLVGCADVADVSKRACEEFGWGAPSRCRLYLVREGRERALAVRDAPSLAADILISANQLDPDFVVLSGSWLLARVPPAAAPGASPAATSGASRAHSLTATRGSLTLQGTFKAAAFDDLIDGGVYTLIGGKNGAVLEKRMWTQVSDKALEESATAAVLEAATKELGEMAVLHDITIFNKAGKCTQFDGLLVNSTAAVFVEAKHSPDPKHLARSPSRLNSLRASHAMAVTRALLASRALCPCLRATSSPPRWLSSASSRASAS